MSILNHLAKKPRSWSSYFWLFTKAARPVRPQLPAMKAGDYLFGLVLQKIS